MTPYKYKNGTKLKLSSTTTILITTCTLNNHDYFGIEPHYGVKIDVSISGQPTIVNHGWIAASILDNMNVVEL
jgi:hypothetical protein